MRIDKQTGEILGPNKDVDWNEFRGHAPIPHDFRTPNDEGQACAAQGLPVPKPVAELEFGADDVNAIPVNPEEMEASNTPEFDALDSLTLTEEQIASLTPAKVQWAYLKAQEQLVALVLEHRNTGITAIVTRHAYERDAAMKRGEIQFKATQESKKMTVDDLKSAVELEMTMREMTVEKWELLTSSGREAIEAKKYELDMLRSLNSALLTELSKTSA